MTLDQAASLREIKRVRNEGGGMADSTALSPGCAASPGAVSRPSRVISITSGKGGVGKTNITANLAYILSRKRKKTMVLDADTGLANIDIILGLTPTYNLYHVLTGEKTLEEVMVRGPGGILVLPASSGIGEMADLTRGQKLTLLDELNALKEPLDFVLMDTAAGISQNVMYFNLAAEEIIVVVTSEPTSLTDAYALIKILYQRHAKKRFRLLVNMARSAVQAREVFERLNHATDHFLNLTIDYLGHVIYDAKLQEAVQFQKPVAELYPAAPATRCLRAVAETLYHEKPEVDEDGTLRFFRKNVLTNGRE